MISSICKKAALVATAAALAVTGMGTGAGADMTALDSGAYLRYTNVVAADSLANFEDTSRSAGDNITCDPAPVVTGTGSPRAQYVAGEVYANVVIAAHWKCASLDTGAVYYIYGTVTDYYYSYSGGYYQAGASDSDSMRSVAGAATVNPARTIQYAGGHPALNTWHYARFEGTTSTGRRIVGTSQLFYVAGI